MRLVLVHEHEFLGLIEVVHLSDTRNFLRDFKLLLMTRGAPCDREELWDAMRCEFGWEILPVSFERLEMP